MNKIHVFTRLGALSRLLTKLGYAPHSMDSENARRLLALETSDLDHINNERDKQVLFIKELK